MSPEKKAPKEESWLPQEARSHLRAARREFRQSIAALLPPDFMRHRRAARREMLLAVRSLIDHALQKMGDGEAA